MKKINETHTHDSMDIATGKIVKATQFTIPGIEDPYEGQDITKLLNKKKNRPSGLKYNKKQKDDSRKQLSLFDTNEDLLKGITVLMLGEGFDEASINKVLDIIEGELIKFPKKKVEESPEPAEGTPKKNNVVPKQVFNLKKENQNIDKQIGYLQAEKAGNDLMVDYHRKQSNK